MSAPRPPRALVAVRPRRPARPVRQGRSSVDFQLDAGIDGDDEAPLYARSRLVLASRVAGVSDPVDGVTTAIGDPGRLVADVDRARRLGFAGKLCIHPRPGPGRQRPIRPDPR